MDWNELRRIPSTVSGRDSVLIDSPSLLKYSLKSIVQWSLDTMVQSANWSSVQLVLKIEQMQVKMQRCNESKDECVMQAMLKGKPFRAAAHSDHTLCSPKNKL